MADASAITKPPDTAPSAAAGVISGSKQVRGRRTSNPPDQSRRLERYKKPFANSAAKIVSLGNSSADRRHEYAREISRSIAFKAIDKK
jgi:hypothetical protein